MSFMDCYYLFREKVLTHPGFVTVVSFSVSSFKKAPSLKGSFGLSIDNTALSTNYIL